MACWPWPSRSLTSLATAPTAAPTSTYPAVQPSRVPRCSRQARASGPASRGSATGGPGRSARSPAPTSRCGSAPRGAEQPGDDRQRQREHPPPLAGERPHLLRPAHRGQPGQPGRGRRRRRPAAGTPARARRPADAGRRPGTEATCAVTARDGGEDQPGRGDARPERDRAGQRQPDRPASPAVHSTATSGCATTATSSAAASSARRPTAAAPTSSGRPASSSARVCRTTSSRLISAASTAPEPPIRQAVSPPTVVRSNAGPEIARNAPGARRRRRPGPGRPRSGRAVVRGRGRRRPSSTSRRSRPAARSGPGAARAAAAAPVPVMPRTSSGPAAPPGSSSP